MQQTLAELRAENAKLEADAAEGSPPDAEENESLAAEDDPQKTEEVGEPNQEEGGKTEAEAWLLAEGEESESVPVAKHVSVRTKLRETVKERDSEIEQLKAQVQQLQSAGQGKPQGFQPTGKPMPKLEDFDHDEAKHAAAVERWIDEKMQARLQVTTQQTAQQQQVQQRQQHINAQVDDHYNRAQELTAKAGISPETYRTADLAVRQAIDAVAPGQGDAVTDDIIAHLGPGSEKVIYHLGRNPSKQAELQQKLRSNPFEAMAYLGELKATITAPVKRKSNAPKPAARDNSGSTSANEEGNLKRRYQNAKSAQDRWKIAREARKKGIDSLSW